VEDPKQEDPKQCVERLYRAKPENRATEADRAATCAFCEEG